MLRKMIKINEDRCDGCGLCKRACHEGAIDIINGKAKLMREDYCDGLGDCLPVCPQNAISFELREAMAYNEAAVSESKKQASCGCISVQPKVMQVQKEERCCPSKEVDSELINWPVQLQLAAVNATYFKNARLLIAADCSAYTYGNFHERFMKNHITLIACPKLDHADYAKKLTEIIKNNTIQSVTIVRMEVPCCGGLEYAVIEALKNSGKFLPWQIITLSADGEILE